MNESVPEVPASADEVNGKGANPVTLEDAPEVPSEPAKPTQLSDIDRLRIENITLKLINVQKQTREIQLTAQQELVKAMNATTNLQKEFASLVEEFRQRYGVDVTKMELDEAGRILGPKKS